MVCGAQAGARCTARFAVNESVCGGQPVDGARFSARCAAASPCPVHGSLRGVRCAVLSAVRGAQFSARCAVHGASLRQIDT